MSLKLFFGLPGPGGGGGGGGVAKKKLCRLKPAPAASCGDHHFLGAMVHASVRDTSPLGGDGLDPGRGVQFYYVIYYYVI